MTVRWLSMSREFTLPTGPSAWQAPWHRFTRGLRRRLAATAFWSGIALPLLYLPLMAQGIETLPRLGLVLGLLGLHLVALLGGREHRR